MFGSGIPNAKQNKQKQTNNFDLPELPNKQLSNTHKHHLHVYRDTYRTQNKTRAPKCNTHASIQPRLEECMHMRESRNRPARPQMRSMQCSIIPSPTRQTQRERKKRRQETEERPKFSPLSSNWPNLFVRDTSPLWDSKATKRARP